MAGFFNFKKDDFPLVYIQDAVIFPGLTAELRFNNKKSIEAVRPLQLNDKLVVVTAKISGPAEPDPADLYTVGVIGRVLSVNFEGGTPAVRFEADERVTIEEMTQEAPNFRAVVRRLEEDRKIDQTGEGLRQTLIALIKQIINTAPFLNLEVALKLLTIREPNQLVNNIMGVVEGQTAEKQDILATVPLNERMQKTITSLEQIIQKLRVEEKVAKKTEEELSKTQKELFLREELKTIQRELGESEANEYEQLRKKIKESGMPPDAEAVAVRELVHLEKTPSFSPEVSYIRNYLDWLLEMPWKKYTETKIDLAEARKILDTDHYGLDRIKERMLEYLAVQKLVGKMKGPILCFIGPPGTGKTSIGQSIARALGRKFIRMSLGGIRDEAEIRGHRRTYVGAMPGRIIQGIRQVGVRNPVFMLDEIDKVGSDYRGDPSSALLEALDPAQNGAFSDHYLEVPFDLSETIFITTANVLETIPPSLRDRMEMIEFSGYTEDEKLAIAKGFIIPKVREQHGLVEKNFFIDEDAILEVIKSYTQEAGVRSLERELAKIARKLSLRIASNEVKDARVTRPDLIKLLGNPKIDVWVKEDRDLAGVVAVLAVTAAGGEVLSVETTAIPEGRGNLTLTGNLGDVMKESALASLSYAKTRAKSFGINPSSAANYDFHVHVPRGAIPKDGPSAGIAIAIGIISALSGRPVNSEVGMTGEITLQGRVLRIGGLKEKVLAAKRVGLKKIILPQANKTDLEEIAPQLLTGLQFYFVNTIDDILPIVFKGTSS